MKTERDLKSGYPTDLLLRVVAKRCADAGISLAEAQRLLDMFYLKAVFEATANKDGSANQSKAAKYAGLHRNTIGRHLKKLPHSVSVSMINKRISLDAVS